MNPRAPSVSETSRSGRSRAVALIALMALQGFCAVFFLWDLLRDLIEGGIHAFDEGHLYLELLANLGLFAGIAFEAHVLMRMLRREAMMQRSLSVASGALHDVMMRSFDDWGLTPAEADVASFAMKGYAIAEISGFRGSAEGTVKTHLNAIYRKAGVSGQSQLVSLLIEDLLRGPVADGGSQLRQPAV